MPDDLAIQAPRRLASWKGGLPEPAATQDKTLLAQPRTPSPRHNLRPDQTQEGSEAMQLLASTAIPAEE